MRKRDIKVWWAVFDLGLRIEGTGRNGRRRAYRHADDVIRKLRGTANVKPLQPETHAGGK